MQQNYLMINVRVETTTGTVLAKCEVSEKSLHCKFLHLSGTHSSSLACLNPWINSTLIQLIMEILKIHVFGGNIGFGLRETDRNEM